MKRMKSLKPKKPRRSFSLLEIVIVIALIAMIGGVAMFSLKDLLGQHRFQAGLDEVKNHLQELQIEALALGSDMEVAFSMDKNVCKVTSKTSEKILRDRIIELKIDKITFNRARAEKVGFKILSTGRFDPPGVLGLEKGKTGLWIDVREPLPIKFSNKYPENFKEFLPQRVLSN